MKDLPFISTFTVGCKCRRTSVLLHTELSAAGSRLMVTAFTEGFISHYAQSFLPTAVTGISGLKKFGFHAA